MSDSHTAKSEPASSDGGASGRLFVLELSGGRMHSMRHDGSNRKVVVADCHLPDGVAIDVEAGHIYWTNMGLSPATNDGSIERADLDGGNRTIIVPSGATYTPKQLQLDKKNGKLYWSDREGMRVMGANLDGSLIETLVETGRGDADAATRPGGAWGSPSIPCASKSTGRRRGPTMPSKAGSCAPGSISPRARLRPIAPISRSAQRTAAASRRRRAGTASGTSMARSEATIPTSRPPTPMPGCSASPPGNPPSCATWHMC